MARSVTFSGVTLYKPGGITRIWAEGLNSIVPGANSVIALLGEAEGGEPGSSAGLVAMDDPGRATEVYRSGPLADAIRAAFQSSNDPAIPGGASRVYVWKTNASTQATLNLPSANASSVVSSVATGGAATTLIDTVDLADYANDTLNGMWVVLRPFSATCEVKRITDFDGATDTISVGSAWASNPVAADPYVVLQDEVELVDEVNVGASTTTSIAVVNAGMTASAHIGRWLYIVAAGPTASPNVPTTVYLRKITANTSSAFTISPSIPAVPAAGAYVNVLPNAVELSSRDYGAHTNGISVEVTDGVGQDQRVFTATFEDKEEASSDLGGPIYMHLLYRGAGTGLAGTSTGASTASILTWTGGGLVVSAHAGKQVLVNGEYVTITDNDATTITLDTPLSAAPVNLDDIVITTLTDSEMRVAGSAGAATSLSTTLRGVTGDNLSLTFAAGETLRQLVSRINANPNYLATIPAGINPDTTLVADFDFGADTAVGIAVSYALDTTVGLKKDVVAMVNYVNSFAQHVEAVRADDAGSSYAGSRRAAAWDPAVVLGAEDPFLMTGGTRGISSNTDFQDGFDALLLIRVNSVVPLIDEDLTNEGYGSTATVASVAAQLADHVAVCRSSAQNVAGERGGFFGFQGTKSAIIAQANDVNDCDVQMVCQHPTILNSAGSLVEFGPRMYAVMAASMRAGAAEVGEPLTFKYIRTSGVTQDSSWDPSDITDANDLIRAGVLFSETIPGRGTRWVRDLTTHVADDNLAFMEGSVRDAVRYVAYNLRDQLVARFTGRKASPATVANIRDAAVAILETFRASNVIVDSTDPSTGAFMKAYHNLKVYASGDIVTLNVGCYPCVGVNFTLNNIYLALPSQSA